jgi:hypothetical protein
MAGEVLQADEKPGAFEGSNRRIDERRYLMGVFAEAPRADYRIEGLRIDIGNRTEIEVNTAPDDTTRCFGIDFFAQRMVTRSPDRHL